MDPVAVLGMFAAGIGGMWWYLKATTDNRIADLKAAHDRDRDEWKLERGRLEADITSLEAKIETQNDTLRQNTNALAKSNENTAILADLIVQLRRDVRESPMSMPPSGTPTT